MWNLLSGAFRTEEKGTIVGRVTMAALRVDTKGYFLINSIELIIMACNRDRDGERKGRGMEGVNTNSASAAA